MAKSKKIAHIITGLGTGGAEILLRSLLPRLQMRGFFSEVFSLTEPGSVGAAIARDGFVVHALAMNRRLPNPLAAVRLARQLRRGGFSLVQTWLYHGDLVGGLAARAAGGTPLVWGVHTSRLDPGWVKTRTRWVAHGCALLSHVLPTRIVCCSSAAASAHRRLGYAANKIVVIPNGIDTHRFAPNLEARKELRRELRIAQDIVLVGMAARYHPSKDHDTFIAAAAAMDPAVHFLLCGQGTDQDNRALVARLEAAGIFNRCSLLGQRDDMPRIFAALDLATLASRSEAAPLVLAEAMSCGVPCVATAVGDCANIIGDSGLVVPAGDAAALAAAWRRLLGESAVVAAARKKAALRRAVERHGLDATAFCYAQLYGDLLS